MASAVSVDPRHTRTRLGPHFHNELHYSSLFMRGLVEKAH